MRVLQVYRDYFGDLRGGIERHVNDVARGLGSEIVVSGRRSIGSRVDDGVTVHVERELARPAGVPLSPGIFRRVRDGYEIVHVHSPNPTGELAAWRLDRKTAVVATYHADSHRSAGLLSAYKVWMRSFLARCDRVIATSQRMADSSPVLRDHSARGGTLDVVPLGVDTARFSPGPRETTERSDPVVLFVGRLRYYKGLPHLIEAVSSIGARLIVVGDGEERARVEAMARAQLQGRFTLLPDVSDEELPQMYRSADVLCLPSTSGAEAFGLAVLEAMSSGIPVVTTEVGTATSEINVDGVTGRVVPPADTPALAGALQDLLGDAALRDRMGAAARERVLSNFDRRRMLDRIAAIYGEVRTERRLPVDG